VSLTADQIIREAMILADIPHPSDEQTNPFATEPQLLSMVNRALGYLHDLLIDAYDDWLTVIDDTLTMTVQNRRTKLPDDFYKLRALFLIDAQQRIELYPFDPLDIAGSTTTDTTSRPQYRIISNEIQWLESPSSSYPLEIWYIRQFSDLVDIYDKPEPEIPNGWDMYVSAWVAHFLITKEEGDTTNIDKLLIQAKASVIPRVASIAAAGTGADSGGCHILRRPER
jgi:hypothetical protein